MARVRASAASPTPTASVAAPAAGTPTEAPKQRSASSFMLAVWGIPILVIVLSIVVRRACIGG